MKVVTTAKIRGRLGAQQIRGPRLGSSNMWRRRYYVGASGLFVMVFGAATIGFALAGHTLIGAAFIGIGCSIVASGLCWGLADILAPKSMLRWRATYLAEGGSKVSRAVATGASLLLDAAGDRPWEDSSVTRRVRLLGIVLVCVFTAMAIALWWLLGVVDAMFSR